MSTQYVLPSATRRVKLTFDKNGDPAFPIVTSPECFKQNALGVLPPRDVIPVIFVPGVMGANLKLKDGSPAWMPPNTTLEGIKAVIGGIRLTPAQRQKLYDPNNTEVSYEGACKVPDSVYWLTEEEARKRGWGSIHAASYLAALNRLEVSLNDQYTKPGRSEEDGNYLLPEIGAGRFLGVPDTKPRPASARPDYEGLAAKLFEAWDKPELPALSEADIKKLADYFYPVYAFGYNWLRSCEDAAQELVKMIDTITARYKTGYFRCEGKVILVSHSLGAHVTRRAAQLAPDKILGVVHGVGPLVGAPVVYRRFRAGTEHSPFNIGEWGFAKVIGDTAEAITPELSCSPGPLELAPSQFYPSGWLKFQHQPSAFGETKILEEYSLPKADPYEEIYKKTTDECWWGMIDPALIDPAGLYVGGSDDPLDICRKAIDTAKTFHQTIGTYIHPQTYGFYGTDPGKYKAFGHVTWHTDYRGGDLPPDLMRRKDVGRTVKGKSWVPADADTAQVIPVGDEIRWYENQTPTILFKLLNEKDQAGDGTVPRDSGRFLEQLNPKMALGIAGYDHQTAYDYDYAYDAAIYGIIRIVQEAKPVVPWNC